jgi:hypothetical protein
MALPVAGEHLAEHISCSAVVDRQGVRVPVEHGGDPGSAAALCGHLRIDARPEKLGCHEVPEVMEATLRQTGHHQRRCRYFREVESGRHGCSPSTSSENTKAAAGRAAPAAVARSTWRWWWALSAATT